MDATAIDSFVIEIGLDASKFDQQQRDALDKFKRTQEAARAGAKDIEASGGKIGDALDGIKTQALQMFAAVAGGKGIIDFSTNLTHADASVGRLQRNIGVSAQSITAWQGAARIFGGDAKAMAQSFTTVSDAFAGWKIGLVTPLIADLRAISTAGGTIIDVNKGVEQSFLDLSANLKAIHDKDPAQAGLLGRKLGIDPALFDLLVRGPEGVKQVLDYVKKIGVATKEDTDAFGELEKRMGQMGVKAEALGRKILGGERGGAAAIVDAADWLNKPAGEAGKDVVDAYKNQIEKSGGFLGFLKDTMTFNWWQDQDKEKKKPPARLFSESPKSPAPTGAFTSQAEKEAFIRAEAQAPGKKPIDPNVAMAVAKSEGFYTFNSSVPGEKSYGAFQLNISRDPTKPSLGDRFKAETGLDPADRVNEKRAIQYALDEVRKDGWRQWYGARNTGISRWAGIGPEGGAGVSASVRSSDPAAAGSTTTSKVEINGPITVTAPAGADADVFANRFAAAIQRQSFAAQANDGQN